MTASCPQCGAPWAVPEACTRRFHHFLALEFSEAAFGSVHHLTVPAYMLQHPDRLSRRGWLAMRLLLAEFLVQGRDPDAVRAASRARLDSGRRTWSLVKGPRLLLPAGFTWSQSILDVPFATAAHYREGITIWALQVLEDLARFPMEARE